MYESFKGLKGYKKNEGKQWEKKATKVLHQQNVTNKDKVVGVVETTSANIFQSETLGAMN